MNSNPTTATTPKTEQEGVLALPEGTIKTGDMVAATMPSNRTSWMFADYCTSTDAPVKDGEVGILLARTACEKMENYSVRLLGRDHDVVFNIAELKPAAHVEERERWVPVSERLPEEGVWVLVATHEVNSLGHFRYAQTAYLLGSGWHQVNGSVSHWQPLPAPPASASAEGASQQKRQLEGV